MGKIIEFSINLDSKQLVYYPGQQVYGELTLELREPMEMRTLKLKFCGEGYCNWDERCGTGENRRKVNFSEKRDFIEELRCIYGSPHAGEAERITHPAGKHTYKFSFRLPHNTPSSFEGIGGHIRYKLKAKIDKPWKFDHKVKRVFTVNEIIDANIAMYLKEAGGEHNKSSGCLFCTSGRIEMEARIDRTCYCPGETILIDVFVNNMSTRDLKELYAILTQLVTYHVNNRNKSKTITKEIARVNGPVVMKGQAVKWERQTLDIIATQPSITNCSVVSVQYVLNVVARVPWGADASVKIPVTVGTIPSIEYAGKDTFLSPVTNFPGVTDYTPLQPRYFGYTDMTPPCYSAVEGCIDVNTADIVKDEYTYGNLVYTPLYTFAKPYQQKEGENKE